MSFYLTVTLQSIILCLSIQTPLKGHDMQLSIERLYRRMELEAVSAAQLAEKVGISRQAMYNILNAKSQPKPETLRKICDALNCDPKSLYGADYYSRTDTDHTRFASVMVDRYRHELSNYDVEAATFEYIRNWFYEHYADLKGEQFEAAKAEAERVGREFAQDISNMVLYLNTCFVGYETQATAAGEAFVSFFETLPSMIDTELPTNPDFDLFEGMHDE